MAPAASRRLNPVARGWDFHALESCKRALPASPHHAHLVEIPAKNHLPQVFIDNEVSLPVEIPTVQHRWGFTF
jgi:hypothetical protein